MKINEFKTYLGTPAYEDADVALYCADSLIAMDKLPNNCVPLTVTSPPYNIGKEYETIKDVESYVDWIASFASKVHRITEETGALWLNLGYLSLPQRAKAIPIPYLIWARMDFFLIQEVVWNYGAGVAGKLFFSPRNEKWLWYAKQADNYVFNLDDVRDKNVKYPNQKKNGKLRCNPLGKNPTDVWQIPKVTSGANRSSAERTAHPAQFPINLVSRIIRASSNKDDVVFDPFVGSGSLLEAAILCGRKAVGIEVEPRYVDIAIKRLKTIRERDSELAKQQSLFR